MDHEARVSCRHVGWLLPMALRRRIPRRHLLNHVTDTDAHLRDPLATIDWNTFALILANLSSWLTDDELVAEGAAAWRDPDFQPWLATATLLPGPVEQITWAVTSPGGPIASLPVTAQIDGSDPGMIEITLSMPANITASRACFRILAGMLRELPARLGGQAAELDLSHGPAHARLRLAVVAERGWNRWRRRVTLPFRSAMAAREFGALAGALAERDEALAHRESRIRRLESERKTLEDTRARLLENLDRGTAANQQLQEKLDLNQKRLDALSAATIEAVFTLDHRGRVISANDAAKRMFPALSQETSGFPVGTDMNDVLPGVLSLRRDERTRLAVGTEDDAALYDVMLTDDAAGTVVFASDATDLERTKQQLEALEIQLQAAQRVDSLGELTSGIAHDFNNLLVAINGYAELGLSHSSLDPELAEYLEEIRGAGERAAGMTGKLLTFARRQEIEPESVDLNALTRGIERIIERLLPRNIRCRFIRSLQAPIVTADPGQLEQVIINLAVNARDAMPDGGELIIAVGQRESFDSKGRRAEFATISIEDSGVGIPDDVAERIFEPFFTTKDEGKGTGLGLSVVSGIVERHGGSIELTSESGQGTRFTIVLPLASTMTARPSTTRASATPAPAPLRGTTLLLVEDNRQVRELAARILEDAGYDVLVAGDGREGIRVFENAPDRIDLVIADIEMPGASGEEVFLAVRALQPEARMLFTTGYGEGSTAGGFVDEHRLAVLRKPYTPEALCRHIQHMLDAAE